MAIPVKHTNLKYFQSKPCQAKILVARRNGKLARLLRVSTTNLSHWLTPVPWQQKEGEGFISMNDSTEGEGREPVMVSQTPRGREPEQIFRSHHAVPVRGKTGTCLQISNM
jgi:hypothetical protein